MCRLMFPKLQFKLERWKWNKEYRVYVSTLGNFKDEHRNIIPVKVNVGGYVVVKTTYGFQKAHRLVMKTWKPCPDMENLTVDHLDHNKRNNTIYNLEWVTKKENEDRAKADFIAEDDNEDLKDNYMVRTQDKAFASFEEAAEYIMKTKKMTRNGDATPSRDRIINRIKSAAYSGNLYCDRKWYLPN